MAPPVALAGRLMLLATVLCSVTARPLPDKLATPDYTLYHTKDGVFQAVREIVDKCPGIMRIDEDSQADGTYSSTLTVVTVEPAGLSPPGADLTGKLRLLLNFGEHGRELISSEIGLSVLRLLCDAEARAPLLTKYKIDPAAVSSVLQRAVFKVVPMENVRGRERVEAGELCERKNGRGVDPNRNWGVHWGFKERDYDPAEEYPGTAAFSEPEAALLLRVARALRPHVWTSVHSGMDALFMPYDHKAQVPEGAGAQATLDILKALNERTCRRKCATGSGGKSVGYLAHGTATDFMWQELNVPVPMTWEVYGDSRASFEDCFRMFNPLTRQAYDATVESWTAAVFTLLTLLPGHPEIAPELEAGSGAGSARQQPQQEEEGQQQQHGDSSISRTAAAAAPREAAVDGGGANASAGKAAEIASALKQHMQQEQQQAQASATEQQGATEAAAAAEGVQRMLGVRRGTVWQQRSVRTAQALTWLAVAGTACVLASYLWSKPRFRYLLSSVLSKHLGLSRRRGSRAGLIPV